MGKLPSIPTARKNAMSSYYKNLIWLVGGYEEVAGFTDSILTLNLRQQPEALEWQELKHLQHVVEAGNIQFQNNIMMVFGYYYGLKSSKQMELYDIDLQQSLFYHDAFNTENDKPASFLQYNTLVVFGGYKRPKIDQMEETAPTSSLQGFEIVQDPNLPVEIVGKE